MTRTIPLKLSFQKLMPVSATQMRVVSLTARHSISILHFFWCWQQGSPPPPACAEWQRCMPVEQSWKQFKIFFSNTHHEHRLVSQTALRSGYHMVNMVVPTPVGPPPRSSNIADFYHSAPLVNEDPGPNIATTLANLATVTGSNRATVAALNKALAGLTAFTQSQAVELRRLARVDTLAGIAPPTQVGKGTATVMRGNGRAHTCEWQKYKTKNNTYCVSH
jgi:hypothetical protein